MSGNADTNMSSPSTPGSDMFPAANEPPASNISPPNSQEAQMTDVVNGQSRLPNTSMPLASRGEDEPEAGKNREPGWGWTNKQAQEEYSRAYEMAVDKDFPEKLQQYGDVLEGQS